MQGNILVNFAQNRKYTTMTQMVLNIEDKNLLPSLRKILSNLKGVTIARTQTVKKGTLSKAVDEVRSGKVTRVATVAELIAELDSIP